MDFRTDLLKTTDSSVTAFAEPRARVHVGRVAWAERLLAVQALLLICSCATLAPIAAESPKDNAFASKHPTLFSIDATKDNQLRDGVRIIVTPIPFRFERSSSSAFRFQPTLLLLNGGPAERLDRSTPEFHPDEVRFKIRISNRLPRVVRLAGTAVAFQLAGRTINVPHERYADFLNGIILPQQEVTLDLVGPSVEEIVGKDFNKLLGDSATLALLLYDVITATDAAGTPTRRSNFEFYYRFALVPAKDSVIQKTCRLKLSMEEYRYLQAASQGDANRWTQVPQWNAVHPCP